jgi:hypothetical protein
MQKGAVWLLSQSNSDRSGYLIILCVQVAALLSGKFQSVIERFYIIDCRYPYEYLGGHILVRLHREHWERRGCGFAFTEKSVGKGSCELQR